MVPPLGQSAKSKAISSLFDQIMSSASNGLIVLAIARVAPVERFGAATLLFAIATAAVGICRGALGTPLMLAAGRGIDDLRREAGFATVTALVLGMLTSLTTLIAAQLLGIPELGNVFALAAPILLTVDVFRYTLISASRPQVAMMWDTAWAVGSALTFASTFFGIHALSDVQMIALWGAFAAASATGMAASLRLKPLLRGVGGWLRETYGPRSRYGLEATLIQLNPVIIASIATAVVGASATASLRGAGTLFSPLAVLLGATPLIIIPEAVRNGTPPAVVWRRLRLIGVSASLFVLSIGPILTFLPESVGESILGESWIYVRAVLPIVALTHAVMVWNAMAMNFLRFQNRSSLLLYTSATYSVILILLCTAMAFLTKSASGIAIGQAVSAIIMATVTTHYARPKSRKRSRADARVPH